MRDVLPWMVAHIACIMTHFAFFVASTFVFVTPSDFGNDFDWDEDRKRTQLSWMSSAIAAFVMFANFVYLSILWTLEQRTADSTGDNRRFNKQLVLALGTTFNAAFMFADFALANAASAYSGEFASIGVMRVFGAIAGMTAFATVVLDVMKLYDLWKQNRETYEVLASMEPEDW